MLEDLFRNSSDVTKQKIWKERIEPFIDEDIYKVWDSQYTEKVQNDFILVDYL